MATHNPSLFFGYDEFVIDQDEFLPGELPKHVRSIESGRLIAFNPDQMTLHTESGEFSLRLKQSAFGLSAATSEIFFSCVANALHGKRKGLTVLKWVNRFSRLMDVIVPLVDKPILTITLSMFLYSTKDDGASNAKTLRSLLKFWIRQGHPGISKDLKDHLSTSKAPKPRSTLEIQANSTQERPFSSQQVREILSTVEDLYVKRVFSPQDYLLWRLIISEAMRPSQLHLLRVGDIKIIRDASGNVIRIFIDTPIVKQKATSARKYMMQYQLSSAVIPAILAQLNYLNAVAGKSLCDSTPLFSVVRRNGKPLSIAKKGMWISSLIARTRAYIANHSDDFNDIEFFTRRFKHTKLTHLAIIGAPLAVLARAGFQTSTISLRHYVNLSAEAFDAYELKMDESHNEIASTFRGEIVSREWQSTHDEQSLILSPSMSEVVGGCAATPCGVLAPIGCYTCSRFRAFKDGPHQEVLDELLFKRNRAVGLQLPLETVQRDDFLIAVVRAVIDQIQNIE
ncbi:MAG: hypothetical protein ABI893_00410 [Polaromonas sp.]